MGGRLETDEILGGMRLHMAKVLDVPREGHDFLWVVNFPLFHWDEETQSYASEHQPFTLPREDELDLLDTNPLAMGLVYLRLCYGRLLRRRRRNAYP